MGVFAMIIYLKKLLKQIVGWIFILLGITGLILPILPGFIFLIIGLYILSATNHWSFKLLNFIRRRFPLISKQADRFMKKIRIMRRK
jgi:uncharacterized membrane protein YbaN (DUF454 family)